MYSAIIRGTVPLWLAVVVGCSGGGQPLSGGDEIADAAPQSEARSMVDPNAWPVVNTPPLDQAVEAQVDRILAMLTLEQKVGQVIQADSASVTPEDVKRYRLGSVLSGGNSAPGPLPYAPVESWLEAADAYYAASVDADGVEVAVPIIWGIDAVHGHNNLVGAVIFPHNIGLGAARDPDLIERIMTVTATELSISGHDWTFAPTLAVPQDDRWGRTYEGFSEDPGIVAAYAPRVVVGLQGEAGSDAFMGTGRVITSAKHFIGDGGTQGGVDQGDALVSEAVLRDVHGAGYVTALEAGAQTVMASFSSWQGQRMHGSEALLTDVLKDQMNFRGFVVGDWNGHALIEGCTATDCPQAFNAGVDMYMAPDSWKGLWESTLAYVEDGTIPMARLDEAVRRILRVKVASGTFDTVRPSARPLAGRTDLLGSTAHREVGREAVRKSLVLLKNEEGLLPLDPAMRVLVIGDGADSIAKASGGWTLSWQGGDLSNDQFPNSETIYDGIASAVQAGGGTVAYDPAPSDQALAAADVVIAVYGEDPYAEFQGDRQDVDFVPNGFDPAALVRARDAGTSVVSIFLSGRPLYVNPEINASDAFVAAFLPGSEGGGVADVLFRTDPSYDFTGRLSFSWPKRPDQAVLNAGDDDYDPLFALGYGLSYGDEGGVGTLAEAVRAEAASPKEVLFTQGQTGGAWTLMAGGQRVGALPFEADGVRVSATDRAAQEDALSVAFERDGSAFLRSYEPVDFSRELTGAMRLAFDIRTDGGASVRVGMGCLSTAAGCAVSVPTGTDWRRVRLPLRCFADAGADLAAVREGFVLFGEAGQRVDLADVRIVPDDGARPDCPQ